MRVVLKPGVLVLSPETEAEQEAFAAWRVGAAGHVFAFDGGSDRGGALIDLGPREEACREPINIVFTQSEARFQPISNLAHTPFRLDGSEYASVEGFWQGLRFSDEADRARVAGLWGLEAKRAVSGVRQPSFDYLGETYPSGGPGHHTLMRRACGSPPQGRAGRGAAVSARIVPHPAGAGRVWSARAPSWPARAVRGSVAAAPPAPWPGSRSADGRGAQGERAPTTGRGRTASAAWMTAARPRARDATDTASAASRAERGALGPVKRKEEAKALDGRRWRWVRWATSWQEGGGGCERHLVAVDDAPAASASRPSVCNCLRVDGLFCTSAAEESCRCARRSQDPN